MSEEASIDLTEDEDFEERPTIPFHFVNCSGITHETPIAKYCSDKTPIKKTVIPSLTPLQSQKQANLKNMSKPVLTNVSVPPLLITVPTLLTNTSNDSIRLITSHETKSPAQVTSKNVLKGNRTQEIETVSVCPESKGDATSRTSNSKIQYKQEDLQMFGITVPQSSIASTPKPPPGKVVIIKKNNRYYKIVIPHNVLPNINNSMGPVLINIPEVGPLVISNDPQSTSTPGEFAIQHLSVNLDAAEQKKDKVEEEETSTSCLNPVHSTLRDKRFCWTYLPGRKRDLDGFTIKDRLGFTNAEKQRARKCAKMVNLTINKYCTSLMKTERKYRELKRSEEKFDMVKLVKINSIIKGQRKQKLDQTVMREIAEDLEVTRSTGKEDLSYNVSMELGTDNDAYSSDLLVTKKVVFLNGSNKKMSVKRRCVESVSQNKDYQLIKTMKLETSLKPCYVEIPLSEEVEAAYTKYCKYRGWVAKLRSRVILTKQNFLHKIQPSKPFLILTEQSRKPGEFLESYRKNSIINNIMFLVDSNSPFPITLSTDKDFLKAVDLGYVHLVERDLLGTYFSDSAVSHDKHEHNYSQSVSSS